tara:strand:+ start:8053 stop:9489 length:1437 start_codon:yes stop_codon:yes gene_type:complete
VEKYFNQTLKKAITAHKEGKLQEAVKLYQEILKHKSKVQLNSNVDLLFTTTYLNLSAVLKALDKLDEAEESSRKAIELKPDYAEAHFNLGVILTSLGKLKEAAESYNKAINFKADYVDAYCNLGNVYNQLGRLEEAEKNYNITIKLNSNYVNALYNLGTLYERLKKYDEAIKKYTRVLEINKNHTDTKNKIIYILDHFLPNDTNDNSIVVANNKLKNIKNNFTLEHGIKKIELANFFNVANKIIQNNNQDLTTNITQIIRRNSINLGCLRHKKIFNELGIISKACFSCFKIQIEPKNVHELFKLFFIFDKLVLPKNNIRKCMIELRPNVSGCYKGLIYCSSTVETNAILKSIFPIIKKFIKGKIKVKRGCTEYEFAYPNYKETNEDNKNFMKYKNEWEKKEILFDAKKSINLKEDKKSLYNISVLDVLIMNNWLDYAKKINDLSYKDISEEIFCSNYISEIISKQLTLRKKEFYHFSI